MTRTTLFRRLGLLLALLLPAAGLGCGGPASPPAIAPAAPQATAQSDVLHDLGIRYWMVTRTDPRPLRIHHLAVDLADPPSTPLRAGRVEVVAVLADDPDGPGPATAALTLPQTLARRAGAAAFVNANPWQAVPDAAGGRTTDWKEGLPVEILGLTVTGRVSRSPAKENHCPFWIDTGGRPHVGQPPDGAAVCQSVAGFGRLLEDGLAVDTAAAPIHPRTALGLAADGRTLYLVVVDGRQSGYSEGLSTGELAAYMLELGCRQAVNLDGGGSSIMLAADGKGGYRTLNDPSTKVDGRSVARPIPVGLAIRKK